MNSVNDSGHSRNARRRRALPGRSAWAFIVVAVLLAVAAAGGTYWYLAREGRVPPLNLESFKGIFGSKTATEAPTAEKVVTDKRSASRKAKEPAKSGATAKKSEPPARKETVVEPLNVESLQADNVAMLKQLQEKIPTGYYLVINTAANRVILHNGDKVEAEMVASCGSGNVLEDPKGGRRWTFDTPRGVFSIKTKVTDPVWIKPDWAFIEEGEPIPKNRADRAEPGMMGDYALGIGDGYFIHGTLYTRLLGRNVSHGCVRLGDADLEKLYKSLALGTQVFIF